MQCNAMIMHDFDMDESYVRINIIRYEIKQNLIVDEFVAVTIWKTRNEQRREEIDGVIILCLNGVSQKLYEV